MNFRPPKSFFISSRIAKSNVFSRETTNMAVTVYIIAEITWIHSDPVDFCETDTWFWI